MLERHVSDARVSARSVFIEDEIHSREGFSFAQLGVRHARSAWLTLASIALLELWLIVIFTGGPIGGTCHKGISDT